MSESMLELAAPASQSHQAIHVIMLTSYHARATEQLSPRRTVDYLAPRTAYSLLRNTFFSPAPALSCIPHYGCIFRFYFHPDFAHRLSSTLFRLQKDMPLHAVVSIPYCPWPTMPDYITSRLGWVRFAGPARSPSASTQFSFRRESSFSFYYYYYIIITHYSPQRQALLPFPTSLAYGS